MDSFAQTETESLYTIYRGVWTNWSHGKVMGLTLTLSRRQGDLLIAFTALFVTLIGTSFWRIACFGMHSLYSSGEARDALYHQRQATLRNSANGMSGLIRSLQMLLAWRSNATKPVRRILPVITLAMLVVYGFGAASGFSSRVSTAMGNEVLISSANCAAPVAISNNITEQLTIYWPYMTKRMSSYANYAQQCYSSNNANANDQQCNTFVTKQLQAQITRNASCPFSAEMCRTPDANIFFDTGLLDTHADLGFNAPPNRRFLYRRTTHCAPLVADGYRNISNYTAPDGGDPNFFSTAYAKYYYGPRNSDLNETATYKYPLLDRFQAADRKTLSAAADYSIGSVEAWTISNTTAPHSSFFPLPALTPSNQPAGDIALLFLSANDIAYTAPVSDPWYHADVPGGHYYIPATGADGLGLEMRAVPFYYRTEPAAALGCVARAQWCNPRSGRCTPLSGYLDVNAGVAGIVADDAERNALDWYRWASLVDAESLAGVPAALGGNGGLASRDGLNYGMQGPLGVDQWQRDVERWHAVSLAAMQGRAVDTATGPVTGGGGGGGGMEKFVVKPNTTEAEGLCGNQKILSTAYSNFSVFGLAFIYAVGGAIILTSWLLEPLVGCWQRKKRRQNNNNDASDYARLEWCANDTLHLQRLAHEELGLGTWKACDQEIPTTEKGDDLLGVLDLDEPEHPRLKAPVLGVAARLDVAGRGDSVRRVREKNKEGPVETRVLEREDSRSVSSWTEAFTDGGSV
ncbi:Cytochrome p450 protein [Lasiodiplodia theobromae]|uniref:Cytochrome p450 protein n=1 Tax=Lasiodiplodia theobromae TaxID=45133 RepID=UPI0015C2F4BA|nr:Cytochrome p450 protein [Lasiodiplodia theobromae]KAF4536316.1 Cytochrome p450 protein [Lasiodiplodia theobromae]